MYRNTLKIALILVYLVIVAGAVVRMTGSGMGCPDWPKCFGYIVPPTEETQLQWQPNHVYEKGQVIIVDKTLQVATQDFTTTTSFEKSHWEQYTKHDYAIFNPWHTWIEYINRLVGALAGVAVFIMALFSFKKWKQNKKITLLSWLTVFLMGFQGWLGATVVYSVLSPFRITLHMAVALLIVAILIYLLYLVRNTNKTVLTSRVFQATTITAFLMTFIQILSGTQVRQFVDESVKRLGYDASALWLDNPEFTFYFHRSFAWFVLFINIYLFVYNQKNNLGYKQLFWVVFLLGIEVTTGLLMYFMDFPFLTQSAHLVIASLIFGIQFYIVLLSWGSNRDEQLSDAL